MIRSYDNYYPNDSYSDFEESLFNDQNGNSSDPDYGYPYTETRRENELSESEMLSLSLDHYYSNYILNNINYKDSYFLLQAELYLSMRRYKESLSACLCFERLKEPNIVSKCIKLVCFYQLNYIKNFKELKDELMTCNLDSVSESLRKNVIGTIQVSTLIPDFMNCLNNMKKSNTY